MTETTARFTLPFLDFNNDHIEVYLKKENDEYVITDIGETISDLRLSNFKINSRRNEILNSYIQSYGVEKMKTKFLFVVQ